MGLCESLCHSHECGLHAGQRMHMCSESPVVEGANGRVSGRPWPWPLTLEDERTRAAPPPGMPLAGRTCEQRASPVL